MATDDNPREVLYAETATWEEIVTASPGSTVILSEKHAEQLEKALKENAGKRRVDA